VGRLEKLLGLPLIRYLVIGFFSAFIAYLFWTIGDSTAKVVFSDPKLGYTVKLGGSIASFVAVFLISLWAFERLHKLQPPPLQEISAFLIPRDDFSFQEEYACKVSVFDTENGERRTIETTPRPEAGFLTVDIRNLGRAESFQIEVRNSGNNVWKSDYHKLSSPRVEMKPKK
jgi:hypothetical protein